MVFKRKILKRFKSKTSSVSLVKTSAPGVEVFTVKGRIKSKHKKIPREFLSSKALFNTRRRAENFIKKDRSLKEIKTKKFKRR